MNPGKLLLSFGIITYSVYSQSTTDLSKTTQVVDPICKGYDLDKTTFLAHPDDCSKYYVCYQGSAIPFECPSLLQWNDDTKSCDYEENAPCGLQETYSLEEAPDKICEGLPLDEVTFLSNPEDCSKYYECYEGVANNFECEPPLLWNPDIDQCDLKENVTCDRDFLL